MIFLLFKQVKCANRSRTNLAHGLSESNYNLAINTKNKSFFGPTWLEHLVSQVWLILTLLTAGLDRFINSTTRSTRSNWINDLFNPISDSNWLYHWFSINLWYRESEPIFTTILYITSILSNPINFSSNKCKTKLVYY